MGPELCRNTDYISQSMDFTESIFVNGMTLTMLPLGPFRKIGSWIGSFRHRQTLKKTLEIIMPVVQQRLAKKAANPRAVFHKDSIEWLIDLTRSIPTENDSRRVSLYLLHNLWAGSAAPGGLVTQMVFQTLLEPKYLECLRLEAEKAVSSHGWSDKALNAMVLQDSFIREINRLYPTGSGPW